jgi:hypothetical protein
MKPSQHIADRLYILSEGKITEQNLNLKQLRARE